ncbi:hemolysin family protein [Nocardioides acrostichi]|uniref:HlyC/CorC family transporter n=1 Tax=Nocardioides acrostichi TaxID=2784339 RepID=A0A930UWH8_9ACTN|nr:hemolysin family protein [Nocardioides acrostichi]MBF4161441.1 HlyC/CorC family transporter [Nocardioides acrostichi]
MWVLTLLLGLLVILAITAATGYFVAQEFAYMSADRSRLAAMAADGDRGAARALDITRRTSFMLSGAQLGITVTALLVGYAAEPLVGAAIGTALGGVGVPTAVGVTIGTMAALVVSTGVQMVLGELFPKNLAIARPERLAIALARSTQLYLRLFGWLIAFFDRASERLLRAVGMEPVHDVEHAVTRDDLGAIVSDSRASGDLAPDLSLLLDRLVEFPDRDVAHAMVPRARVGVVTTDLTLAELWETTSRDAHSRHPVLDVSGDVVGVVDLLDVLDRLEAQGTPDGSAAARVSEVMRPPLLVPASMRLPDALTTLLDATSPLACVLDEHGELAGVVTVEDLAEELVGEIDDEHDPVSHLDPDDPDAPGAVGEEVVEWRLAGALPLDEVARRIGRPLPACSQETLGGLVVAVLGRLPVEGDAVAVELPSGPMASEHTPVTRLHLQVLEVRRHVPALVLARLGEDTA